MKLSRRARQASARASADNLIKKLHAQVRSQHEVIELLACIIADVKHQRDPLISDRLRCVEGTLDCVSKGRRAPQLARLHRNVAAHVPDEVVGHRMVSSLSHKERRLAQKGVPPTTPPRRAAGLSPATVASDSGSFAPDACGIEDAMELPSVPNLPFGDSCKVEPGICKAGDCSERVPALSGAFLRRELQIISLDELIPKPPLSPHTFVTEPDEQSVLECAFRLAPAPPAPGCWLGAPAQSTASPAPVPKGADEPPLFE